MNGLSSKAADAVGGIILLGMPGAGKGTQALEIQKRHGIPEISTGDILRDRVRRGTELGRSAAPVMQGGGLVPDSLLNAMVEERLGQADCEAGFILDGYPRTESQADFLDDLMARTARRPPRVVLLDVPVERLVERLTQRRSCPTCGAIYNLHLKPPRVEGRCDTDASELLHRADDREDTVRSRIRTFVEKTSAAIDHYRKLERLMVVNADRDPRAIAAEVETLLES